MTSRRLPLRAPDLTAAVKSSPRSMRCAAASTSGSETSAALAATRREDGAAGAGAHALAEAVHLGATAVVRLKGPLAHGCTPGRMIGTVRHGDRGTVARAGRPMGRDLTPRERLHNSTVAPPEGSNARLAPRVRNPPLSAGPRPRPAGLRRPRRACPRGVGNRATHPVEPRRRTSDMPCLYEPNRKREERQGATLTLSPRVDNSVEYSIVYLDSSGSRAGTT